MTSSSAPCAPSSALWRTVSSMFGRLNEAAMIWGFDSPRQRTMDSWTRGVALAWWVEGDA
jgi:hypothetical protein